MTALGEPLVNADDARRAAEIDIVLHDGTVPATIQEHP